MAMKKVDGTKLDKDLKDIANAIRTKTSNNVNLQFPNEFVSAINSIQVGGGNSGGGSNIELSHVIVPEMPKFTSGIGNVELWGWGQGKTPTGNEWDRPSYIFIGTKYSEYIGGTEFNLNSLQLNSDGSIRGIPNLEKGELMAIRKENK